MLFKIPNYADLNIENIVFDYNGTLAVNGVLNKATKELLKALCEEFKVYVITADTFGSVKQELAEFNLEVIVLETNDHTLEKANFVHKLGADSCIALGNGNNDAKMLEVAKLSIAILGKEGCATRTMLASDISCHSIDDAINLFLNPNRLIATLRS